MRSTFKNLSLVLLGSLLGAAMILGYTGLQPASTSPAGATYPVARASISRSASPGLAEDAAVAIYQQLGPAVVNVTNSRTAAQGRSQDPFPERGVGSGVIIDEQGHILTNNHVVDKADKLEVTLNDGTRVPARLIGRDPGDDLALIRIDLSDDLRSRIAVASLGDSDLLKPGQLAIAIGNPFGFQGSMTSGIVSSIGRSFPTDSGRLVRNMIQTDAAINPGNSGGPLINSAGEVVGINTAIESPVRGFVGIGLAVPINTARRHLPEMLAGGTVGHPWLGISGMTITEDLARAAGLGITSGVYVVHVLPGSPAQKAAIRGAVSTDRSSGGSFDQVPPGGDVVISVDGQPVMSTEELIGYVDSKQVGDQISLTILRDGKQQEVQTTLARWPDS